MNKPLTIFNLTLGADTAGQGIRIKQAFDRHTDWSVRSMVSTETYLRYPIDLPYRERLARELYDAADVVHLHNTLEAHKRFDNGQGKPTVLHHHGSAFRWHHERLAPQARAVGAVQICSTADLTIYDPDVTWLPAPYNADELAQIRADNYRESDVIRIAHAPTNRKVKNTALVIEAVERLAEKYPVELVLIENTSWAKCLKAKATADIFVDQLLLGYGCNAIEAWGMGIPVVAGVNPDPVVPFTPDEAKRTRAAMKSLWGSLPFYSATPQNLEKRLERLVQSADLRAEWSEKGKAHFDRFHDEREVVKRLQAIYRSAPATEPGPPRRQLHLTAREIRRGVASARGAVA
jgi:glycosyltransferase involved in cell wall biosynthesis